MNQNNNPMNKTIPQLKADAERALKIAQAFAGMNGNLDELEALANADDSQRKCILREHVEFSGKQRLEIAELTINSLKAQLAARDTKIAALEGEIQKLKARPQLDEAAISRKAVELVASIGHRPANIDPADTSGLSLMEQYDKEKDPKQKEVIYRQIMEGAK
jgi:hypothetical protein